MRRDLVLFPKDSSPMADREPETLVSRAPRSIRVETRVASGMTYLSAVKKVFSVQVLRRQPVAFLRSYSSAMFRRLALCDPSEYDIVLEAWSLGWGDGGDHLSAWNWEKVPKLKQEDDPI